ncbi:SpaA isopeptide-forming pilin-related protein [Enemella sp. A6]|uniref:SpaA isopeptide-forming pilin-related protein n=1 Tax=Enemella sp. A6 TaxID=3440152 RepID=UPI003EBE240C
MLTTPASGPTRAGPARRRIGYVVMAFVIAVTGVLTGAPAQQAHAYIPRAIPVGVGSPDKDVSVAVTLTDSKDVGQPGEQFSYTGRLTVNVPSADPVTFRFAQDMLGPLTRPPRPTDFRWNDGRERSFASGPTFTDGAWVVTFNGPINTFADFTLPAKVSPNAMPGNTINGQVSVKAKVMPSISFTEVIDPDDKGFVADPGKLCTGVFRNTARLDGGGYGAWLGDIKLGDVNRNITYDRDAPTITIRDRNGEIITPQAGVDMVWKPDDPTAPYIPSGAPAGTTWEQSMNWPLDVTTYTGEVWIPDGATITIEQHGTINGCSSSGGHTHIPSWRSVTTVFAGSPERVRSAEAADSFEIPGGAPVGWCADNLYVSTAEATAKLYVWDGATTVQSGNVGTETHALAATDKHERLIFSVNRSEELVIRNLSTGAVTTSSTVLTQLSSVDALAFDPEGNLWAGYQATLYYLTAAQVNAIVTSPNTPQTWNRGATLNPFGGSTADFAFDGAGNLWIAKLKSSDNKYYIQKVPTAGLMGTGQVAPGPELPTGVTSDGQTLIRGLAFVGDTLYVGRRRTGNNSTLFPQFYSVNQTTGALTAVRNGFNAPYLSDFASCSFPAPAPAFRIRKNTGQDRITLAPDQTTVTVPFTVTVDNISSTTATSAPIQDRPQVPLGFRITGVTVDGGPATLNPDGTITLAAGGVTLPAGRSTIYTIAITYAVDQSRFTDESVEWLGECATGTPPDPRRGIYNLVEMADDADGPDNNDACVPVDVPRFKVNKAVQDSPPGTTGPPVVVGADGTVRVSYVVTVTNSGKVAAAHPQITDQVTVPEGFEITGVTLGGADQSTSGQFTIPKGTTPLQPNTSRPYTVVLTARAPDLKAVDWSAAGTCYTDGAGNPAAGGFFNLVEMAGDSDGPNNNDACVPAQRTGFATSKVTAQEMITLAPGQTSITIDYTITVSNTGNTEGTSAPVYDLPETPPGFTIGSIRHSGGAVIPVNPDGTYTVTPGVSLQPFTGRDFVISVTYKVDQSRFTDESLADLGECRTGTPPDKTKGLYNLITMTDDTDGPDNNDECVPVQVLKFMVNKAVQGSEPGTTGPPVTVGDDGTVQVSYVVTVTNSGTVAAPHPAITDRVSVPPGFEITGVTLSGVGQGTSGTFTIPAGAASLAPGASTRYTVVLTARVADPEAVDWQKAGTCNTEGAGNPADGGFFNLVEMTGDSDGPNNNDACVPVERPQTPISIQKYGRNCDTGVETCPMPGAAFALYDVDPGTAGATPIAGAIAVDPNNGAVFTSMDLEYGRTYWLIEAGAPTGHNLLATPIEFRVTLDGIVLTNPDAHAGVVQVSTSNGLILQVFDQTKGDLPKAGGNGPWPNIIVGLMLLGAAAFGMFQSDRPKQALVRRRA